MAYQNVGTPRFYIDEFSYAKAMGVHIPDDQYPSFLQESGGWHYDYDNPTQVDFLSPIGINPSNTKTNSTTQQHMTFHFGDDTSTILPAGTGINFIAILGHNYKDKSSNPFFHRARVTLEGDDDDLIFEPRFTDICNWGDSLSQFQPEYDGFSIGGIYNMDNPATTQPFSSFYVSTGMYGGGTTMTKSGSCIVGKFYNMPHSPDLNLKLSYEYDGVKTLESKNGGTLSNAMFTGSPNWGDGGAWQLYNPENPDFGVGKNYRTGRRTWDLSFSYLADENVFPINAGTSVFTGGGSPWEHNSNIYSNDNSDFFSRVWNKTLGNALPFIFQPDAPVFNESTEEYEGGNSNPDQFAICKFVGDTLQYEQVAHNTYNVKLKIEEVW